MEIKKTFLDYTNALMYEMEKAFYDERGKGARFRLTTIGNNFYKDQCKPVIKSHEISDMIKAIENVLLDSGIVTKIEPVVEDRLLRIKVNGCLHRPVEEEMKTHGIEPFSCIPANLIVHAIEENLNRPVEMAEIKIEDGICQLFLILFDPRPS
jgi:hypothetical protein